MDDIYYSWLQLNDRTFYFLVAANRNSYWFGQLAHFFAAYGIVLSIFSLIYLLFVNRINTLFAAVLAVIFAAVLSFLAHIFWIGSLIGNTLSALPSVHVYLPAAVGTAALLYGHKKFGSANLLLAIIVAVARIAKAELLPSGIFSAAIVGVLAGTLAFWFIEHFEHFWRQNSA